MTPEQFLAAMRKLSPEFHPWAKKHGYAEVGAAYSRLTHAMADFVDTVRAHPDSSYKEAVAILEGLVKRFPRMNDDLEDELEARLRVFLAGQPTAEEPTYGKPEDGPEEAPSAA